MDHFNRNFSIIHTRKYKWVEKLDHKPINRILRRFFGTWVLGDDYIRPKGEQKNIFFHPYIVIINMAGAPKENFQIMKLLFDMVIHKIHWQKW